MAKKLKLQQTFSVKNLINWEVLNNTIQSNIVEKVSHLNTTIYDDGSFSYKIEIHLKDGNK